MRCCCFELPNLLEKVTISPELFTGELSFSITVGYVALLTLINPYL